MTKGIWRTVGGRRIFIKDGEDLSTAMINSGKFKSKNNKIIKDAIKEFGTTEDFREAGYIVTTGELLDFSGKKDGGPSGSRSMDHREISEIMDDGTEGSQAMQNFLEMGNIRVSPESGGLEIAKMPTESQIIKIYDYVDEFDGEIYVDFTGDSIYSKLESKEYKSGTSSSKVWKDIKNHFNK